MQNIAQETTTTTQKSPSPSTDQKQNSIKFISKDSKKQSGTKKNRGSKFSKKNRKAKKAVVKSREHVNSYISVCCSSSALKPRCGDAINGDIENRYGLGHFRCTSCKKLCVVTVSKAKPKKEVNVQEAPTNIEVP